MKPVTYMHRKTGNWCFNEGGRFLVITSHRRPYRLFYLAIDLVPPTGRFLRFIYTDYAGWRITLKPLCEIP